MKRGYGRFAVVSLVLCFSIMAAGEGRAQTVKSGAVSPVTAGPEGVVADSLKPGEVIACYFDCQLFAGEWGVARLVTPASGETRGEQEVEWRYNSHATAKGARSWTKYAITQSHPAGKDDIKKGLVVVYGAANKMRRGVVKDLMLYKNRVVIEWFHAPKERIYTDEVDLKIVRIIDEPKMEDPRLKK